MPFLSFEAGSGAMNEFAVYAVTSSIFAISLPILWYFRKLTTGKMVLFLFLLDITMTIEAALYSDVVAIALLHVITIPAFFALIYVDLVKQHKTKFQCFICSKAIQEGEEDDVVKRYVHGEWKEISVHSSCILLEKHQRKAFSKDSFKKGIPE
jgi:hypothetical protein